MQTRTFYVLYNREEVFWCLRMIDGLAKGRQFRDAELVMERVVLSRPDSEKEKVWRTLEEEYDCERQASWKFNKDGIVQPVSSEGFPIRCTTAFFNDAE